MMRSSSIAYLLLLITLLTFTLTAEARPLEYTKHAKVPIYVNNVGPFHNPAESYKYYSLPFCTAERTNSVAAHADADKHKSAGATPDEHIDEDDNLGSVLAGDRRRTSAYDIRYLIETEWSALCSFSLTQSDIKQFIDAIKQHYIFELYIDELPVKGFVGEIEEVISRHGDTHIHNETSYYLFTHLDFSIAWNDGNVIAVNLTTDPTQRVKLVYGEDIPVEFSYSAHWKHVDTPVADRMSLHSRSTIGDQSLEIHWLSIVNSFVLVILLTAFLGMILMRALHKDFARYMDQEEGGAEENGNADDQEETGWKLVHADVFRPPSNIMLLSSAVGNGAQILFLIAFVLLLAIIETFSPAGSSNRGAVYSAVLILYILTTIIAGYVGTSLYLSLGGVTWASQSCLTACLFTAPFFATFAACNSVAAWYGSSSALPFITILLIILLWAGLSVPLTIVGSMRARHHHTSLLNAPATIGGVKISYTTTNAQTGGVVTFNTSNCKTNRVEREIPTMNIPWYKSFPVALIISALLPFSAIYIELHYVFSSIWGHRVYTLFGILTLAFMMLLIVTAFITVALIYFQLCSENYKWWWNSFWFGASTGVLIELYAVFYYHQRSEMSGVIQSMFFFGYTMCVSYAFALMLGTVAFVSAMKFVQHIYRSIKID